MYVLIFCFILATIIMLTVEKVNPAKKRGTDMQNYHNVDTVPGGDNFKARVDVLITCVSQVFLIYPVYPDHLR